MMTSRIHYTRTNNKSARMDPSRHRFQTKLSLGLLAFFLVALTTLSWIYAPPDDDNSNSTVQHLRFLEEDNNDDDYYNGGDYSGFSCHEMYNKTPTTGNNQCQFARTCNGGEGMWLPFVFCSETFSVKTWCAILFPFILLWLVVMFRLLGSTAEDYFSPSLEYFSVKAKLPPRFAGVTLLALGNGAADVSATVNAITNDPESGYQMSLGALTGAAMFVGGIVSALIILVAGGVPCRGALVRDVLSLFITMIVLWVHFGRGHIGPEAISLFLTLYGCFVVLVLVADVYHRGVVLPRQAVQAQQRERERQLQAANDVNELVNGGLESSLELQPGNNNNNNNNGGGAHSSAIGNVLSALSNYQGGEGAEQTGWGVDSEELQDQPVMLHGAHGILRGTPRTHPPPAGDAGTPYAALEDAADRICAEPGPAGGNVSYNWTSAWEEGKQEIVDHAGQVWEDIMYDGDLHWAEKFMLLCELPFTFFRKVSGVDYCSSLVFF